MTADDGKIEARTHCPACGKTPRNVIRSKRYVRGATRDCFCDAICEVLGNWNYLMCRIAAELEARERKAFEAGVRIADGPNVDWSDRATVDALFDEWKAQK